MINKLGHYTTAMRLLLPVLIALSIGCAGQINLEGHHAVNWPNLDLAISSAKEVMAMEFPDHPELQSFDVDLYGFDDFLYGGSCVNWFQLNGKTTLVYGCTERFCGARFGFQCTWVISIREFYYSTGGLVDPAESAFFWEVADRMVPLRLNWKMPADLNAWHTEPRCVALRDRMINKYLERRAVKG